MGKEYVVIPADPEFETFWKAYPKKLDKGQARKAWVQTAPIRPDTATLIKAVIVQKNQEQWILEGGKWIPYPATWLRGERWEDVSEVELGDVVKGKMWFETTVGVDQKAAELGLTWDNASETYQDFTARVKRAAVPLRAVA